MHDHSRFQRDINDVTGVSLSLSLSLSLTLTKVTDAQYRKRFRASYNVQVTVTLPASRDVGEMLEHGGKIVEAFVPKPRVEA